MDELDPRAGRTLGRYFLVDGLAAAPRLTEDDQRHLTRVMRARPGDGLVGIDGRGGSLALRVAGVERKSLSLEAVGAPRIAPPPGAEGCALPAVEVVVAPPRPGRLEPMLERLTQLGVARVRLVLCRRTGPEDRRPRPERLARILRESAKQSGTAWLPELDGPCELTEGAASAERVLWCDPTAEEPLLDVLLRMRDELLRRVTGLGLAERPQPAVAVVVGPEGGFAPDEREQLVEAGARPVRLGPTVLRIETAAELAAGAALLVGVRT